MATRSGVPYSRPPSPISPLSPDPPPSAIPFHLIFHFSPTPNQPRPNPLSLAGPLKRLEVPFDPSCTRFLRSGDLFVSFLPPPDFDCSRLLALDRLGDWDVSVSPPRPRLRQGIIRGVDLSLTDDDLLDNLREFGVSAVRRLPSRSPSLLPSTSVVLSFSTPSLPPSVFLGFLSLPVSPFIAPPRQCFRCQRFGHLSSSCRGAERCRRCAGAHLASNCPEPDRIRCANCGGGHPASARSCPHSVRAWNIRRHVELEGLTFKEACSRVGPPPRRSFADAVSGPPCPPPPALASSSPPPAAPSPPPSCPPSAPLPPPTTPGPCPPPSALSADSWLSLKQTKAIFLALFQFLCLNLQVTSHTETQALAEHLCHLIQSTAGTSLSATNSLLNSLTQHG